MDGTLNFDGKKYISAKLAAKEFDYSSDYIGQLCRRKKIDAKLIGRTWYVLEKDIAEHKKSQSHFLDKLPNLPIAGSDRFDELSALEKPIVEAEGKKSKPENSLERGGGEVEVLVVENRPKPARYSRLGTLNRSRLADIASENIAHLKDDAALFPNLVKKIDPEQLKFIALSRIEQRLQERKIRPRFERFVIQATVVIFGLLFVLTGGLFADLGEKADQALSADFDGRVARELAYVYGPLVGGIAEGGEQMEGGFFDLPKNSQLASPVVVYLDKINIFSRIKNLTHKLIEPWLDEERPKEVLVQEKIVEVEKEKIVYLPTEPAKSTPAEYKPSLVYNVSGVSKEYVDIKIAELKNWFLLNPLAPNVNRYYITNQNDRIVDLISRSSGGGSSSGGGGLALSDLSATGPILYNSSTGNFSFDLSANNHWTGLNQFANISSSALSASEAYFGGTATSTFGADGRLTTPGLTLSGLTGTIQCLHVDENGVVSGMGADCGTSSGGLISLNGQTGPSQTFATSTSTGLNLNISSLGNVHTFSLSSAPDYAVPLSASTTAWNDFYDAPSSRITAGTNLSWSGNTLNATGGSAVWGSITGTLSSQTDLQNVLNGKINVGTTSVGSITALPNLLITESQISDLDHYTNSDTNSYIHSSTTIPKLYSANTWTNTNSIAAALLNITGLNNGCIEISGGYLTSTGSNCGTGSGGITSLNGEIGSSQTFATSSANGGWGFTSLSGVHTLNIPIQNGSQAAGLLSSADWTAFNAKQSALGFTPLDASLYYSTTTHPNISSLPSLSITKSQVSDFGTYENPLTFSWPLSRAANVISWNGLSTTTNWTVGDLAQVASDGTIRSIATSSLGLQSTLQGTQGQLAYFSGANQAVGTSSLFIAPSGDVGIGLTNPNVPLHVLGSSGFPIAKIERTTTETINTWGTLGLLVSTTGNMADTFGPSFSYFIKDNAGVENPIMSISAERDGADGTGRLQIKPYLNGTIQNNLFVFRASGNLGIGTASPGDKLTVGAYETPSFISNQDKTIGVYGDGAAYFRGRDTTNDIEFIMGTSASGYPFIGSITNHPLVLRVNNALEVMRLDTNGNVGVGTTSPWQKLSVDGSFSLTGALFDSSASAGTDGMVLQTTGSGTQWVATSTLGISTVASSTLLSDNNTWTGTNSIASNKLNITGLNNGCIEISGGYLTSTGSNCGTGSGGITSLNGEIGSSQTFATSSANGGWGFTSLSGVHTLNIPIQNGSQAAGLLSSADWTAFNAKQSALGFTPLDASLYYSTTTHPNISSLPSLSITKSQVSDFGTYENPLTFTYPLTRSANTVSLSFGTTTSNIWSGTNTFNNSVTLGGVAINSILSTNSSGQVVATSTLTFGNFNATSTTVTSTIAGGLIVSGDSLVVDHFNGRVGIKTDSPVETLDVNGNIKVNSGVGFGDFGTAFNAGGIYITRGLHPSLFADAMNLGGWGGFTFSTNDTPGATSTPRVVIDVEGNIGLGTTSPYTKLGVAGTIVADNIFSTSTTATSTFAGGVEINKGLNLSNGYIYGAGLTSCSGLSDKLIWNSATGQFGCGADAGAGGGVTAIGAQYSVFQTGASQTLATSSDTNIGLTITSSGDTHTFTPTWTGTLSVARGGTNISSPTSAGVLLGNYAGTGYMQLSTSTLGLPTFSDLTSNLSNYLSLTSWYSTTTHGSISSLPALSITKSQVSDFGTYEAPLTFSWPLLRSSNTISWNGLSTTTNWTLGDLAQVASDGTIRSIATSSLNIAGSDIVNNLGWTSNSGTVTSVGLTAPTGLTITGSPVTTSGTLALGLDTSYVIPLSASTTNWNTFYDTPSNRITAGTNLSWTGNTLNFVNPGYISGVAWGQITGTLSDQTDLQSALDAKLTASSYYATTTHGNISSLPALSITKSQVSDFGTYENPLTFSWPLLRSSNTISWNGLSTTTNWTLGDLAQVASDGTIRSVATSSLNIALSDTVGTLSPLRGGTGTSTPGSWGDVLYWNGSNWQGVATSSLGISGGGGGGGTWGSITGTLSDQTDLQNALNSKLSTALTEGHLLVGDGSGQAQATSSIFIASNGNIGLGLTAPKRRLTIDSTDQVGLELQTSGTNEFAGIYFSENGGAARLAIQKNNNNGLGFWTATGSEGSESWEARMLLQPSGALGINYIPIEGLHRLAVEGRFGGALFVEDGSDAANMGGVWISGGDNVNGQDGATIDVGGGNDTDGGGDVVINAGAGASSDQNGSIVLGNNVGNVGVGTTSPWKKLSVSGDMSLVGALFDSSASAGVSGMVLQTTGSGVQWVATSTLGISSGGATWGSITGTLSDQTDLQSALDAKLTASSYYATTTHPNISSLPSLSITKSQVSDFGTYENPLTFIWPLVRSTNTISWDVSTTTASCAGTLSCSPFTVIGSSPVTLTGTGGGGGLSTTSPWTIGQLVRVTDNGTVESIATSSLNIALSDTVGTLSPLRGGTGTSTPGSWGDVLYWNGSNWQGVATSSLGISGGGGGGGTWGSITGTLSDQTDLQNALNSKLSTALTEGHLLVGDGSGQAQATSSIFISSAGNIGIGLTSPSSKLHIQGAADGSILRLATSTGGTAIEINQWGAFVQRVASSSAFSVQRPGGTPIFEVDTLSDTSSGLDITASSGQSDNMLNLFSSSGVFLSGFSAYGGLYMNVSSSTAVSVYDGLGNAAFVVNSTSGSVGIGTSTLTYALNVAGNSASSYVARIHNSNTGNNADGLLISLGIANDSRNTNNYFVAFGDGTGTVAGKIQGAGSSAVAYTTSGADLAEYFRAADKADLPRSGEIVMLKEGSDGEVVRADAVLLLGQEPIGIVSTNPGFVGNAPICRAEDSNCDTNHRRYNVLVALAGQVPVKVSEENGEILPGDYLTLSSTTPGVAVKMTESGYSVGRALRRAATTPVSSDSATTSAKTVMIMVERGWRQISDPNLRLLADEGAAAGGFTDLFGFLREIGLEIGQNFVKIVNLAVEKLTAKRVVTEELCIDDVCVNKEQLKAMLISANQSVGGGGDNNSGNDQQDPNDNNNNDGQNDPGDGNGGNTDGDGGDLNDDGGNDDGTQNSDPNSDNANTDGDGNTGNTDDANTGGDTNGQSTGTDSDSGSDKGTDTAGQSADNSAGVETNSETQPESNP